jgi:hypothetical protein
VKIKLTEVENGSKQPRTVEIGVRMLPKKRKLPPGKDAAGAVDAAK